MDVELGDLASQSRGGGTDVCRGELADRHLAYDLDSAVAGGDLRAQPLGRGPSADEQDALGGCHRVRELTPAGPGDHRGAEHRGPEDQLLGSAEVSTDKHALEDGEEEDI